MKISNLRWMVGLLAVSFGLSLGLAVSTVYAHGGDPTKIHSCVNNSSGEIKIVAPNDSCHPNETPLDWDTASRTTPRKLNVNCNAGERINDVINDLISRDVLLVSGTCNENVRVGAGRRNITLDGQGTATINGPDITRATVDIEGRDITVTGFTVRGGRDGVRILEGGTATIGNSTITNVGRDGINLTRGGVAIVNNNTIQNAGRHGIAVVQDSSARIGNSTIQNNTSIGILVTESSSARIGILFLFRYSS